MIGTEKQIKYAEALNAKAGITNPQMQYSSIYIEAFPIAEAKRASQIGTLQELIGNYKNAVEIFEAIFLPKVNLSKFTIEKNKEMFMKMIAVKTINLLMACTDNLIGLETDKKQMVFISYLEKYVEKITNTDMAKSYYQYPVVDLYNMLCERIFTKEVMEKIGDDSNVFRV